MYVIDCRIIIRVRSLIIALAKSEKLAFPVVTKVVRASSILENAFFTVLSARFAKLPASSRILVKPRLKPSSNDFDEFSADSSAYRLALAKDN